METSLKKEKQRTRMGERGDGATEQAMPRLATTCSPHLIVGLLFPNGV